MRKETAATWSVIMAVAMWPLGAFGFIAILADVAPGTSAYEMWFYKAMYGGLPITSAFGFLIAASWLSGYSFPEAKVRAVASAILCLSFIGLMFWGTFLGPLVAL